VQEKRRLGFPNSYVLFSKRSFVKKEPLLQGMYYRNRHQPRQGVVGEFFGA